MRREKEIMYNVRHNQLNASLFLFYCGCILCQARPLLSTNQRELLKYAAKKKVIKCVLACMIYFAIFLICKKTRISRKNKTPLLPCCSGGMLDLGLENGDRDFLDYRIKSHHD